MIKFGMGFIAVVLLGSPVFASNIIDIQQIGDTNTSITRQDGDGNRIVGAIKEEIIGVPTAMIDLGAPAFQMGNSNELNVTQTGGDNLLGVYQKGSDTDLTVIQSGGSELAIHVEVGGVNSITITQDPGAKATITHGPVGGDFNCSVVSATGPVC